MTNKFRTAGLAASTLAVVLLGGCATMSRGTRVEWRVESNPVGAKVETTLGWSCNTPCSRKLQRNVEFDVTVSAPGYKSRTVHIDKRFNKGGAITFAGGPLSAGIDFKNGAAFDLAPNPLIVTLEPEAP
ncbi:translation initiation factor 2 [Caulobacter sp. NIBR1757]|uniref:translation initiation factor 2 n=1 Tax=Caulobacter sp. NIBR1757 TaxID=3016000 RepID=UPI0022F0477B|nr:translation initiation factor 2 [Caulobacter sp. NIBR1757]WGM37896.1 hypothetical protein AMEJIAPC_00797 [Caulobacter sp. NIBR1757]